MLEVLGKLFWTAIAWSVTNFWVTAAFFSSMTKRTTARSLLVSLCFLPVALLFYFAFDRSYWSTLWAALFGDRDGMIQTFGKLLMMVVLTLGWNYGIPLLLAGIVAGRSRD